jgi:hypothetical protein
MAPSQACHIIMLPNIPAHVFISLPKKIALQKALTETCTPSKLSQALALRKVSGLNFGRDSNYLDSSFRGSSRNTLVHLHKLFCDGVPSHISQIIMHRSYYHSTLYLYICSSKFTINKHGRCPEWLYGEAFKMKQSWQLKGIFLVY